VKYYFQIEPIGGCIVIIDVIYCYYTSCYVHSASKFNCVRIKKLTPSKINPIKTLDLHGLTNERSSTGVFNNAIFKNRAKQYYNKRKTSIFIAPPLYMQSCMFIITICFKIRCLEIPVFISCYSYRVLGINKRIKNFLFQPV